MIIDEDVYLEHFGVKGMRWGVRNERDDSSPRTKLGEHNLRVNTERHNMLKARAAKSNIRISELQAEIKALPPRAYYRRQKLIDEKNATVANRKRDLRRAKNPPTAGLTTTQKRVLVGAGVVAVVVGYSVASKYYDSEGARAAIRRGRSQMQYGDVFKHDESLSGKMSPREVLERVSKGVNPNYRSPGGQMNCRRCTFAYELRRRGYDVEATTSAFGRGQNESGLVNALIKGDRNLLSRSSVSAFASGNSELGVRNRAVRGDFRRHSATTDSVREISNLRAALSRHPPGARGEVLFDMGPFAHSMQWENFNGVPHIFDSQKGVLYPVNARGMEALTHKWGMPSVMEITRLDNVDLDLEFLSRWATNRGG